MIPWDDKPATVTTATFKRIKDYVLGLKGAEADGRIIVSRRNCAAAWRPPMPAGDSPTPRC